jgi:hypothetical protein
VNRIVPAPDLLRREESGIQVRGAGENLQLGGFLMRSTGRELWQWTQIGWGPSHGPNGGLADSLDEAKAAFRGAWERGL